MMMTKKFQQPVLACFILLLAVSFYLFEYLIQVAPAVMTEPLMREYGLNVASLGAVLAFFYYVYSPMQLPGGLLYDRFGPRLILSVFMGICVLGALVFAYATNEAFLAVGRFLMGLGGAVSFVGPLVLAGRWFPAKYFALIAGFVQMLGAVGAILGQVVVARIVEAVGWRAAMLDAVILGAVLLVLMACVVRDYPKGATIPPKKKLGVGELHNLKTILSKSQTYIIALYSCFAWLPVIVFAALWGVSFIVSMYQIKVSHAAMLMGFLWIGVAVGSPFFGWWSEKIMRRCVPLATAGLIGAIASGFLLFFQMPIPAVCLALFFMGIGTSGQSLSFAVVRESNKPQTAGTAMGFNNLMVVAGGALGQPLVGWLIYLSWDHVKRHGVPVYALNDYQHALIIIPISFMLVFIFGQFFIKETRCQIQGN